MNRTKLISRPALAVASGLVLWITLASAQDAAPPPALVEPGPERDGAVKAGANTIKQAQALAKKKKYAAAVELLEPLAREWPAAIHDCNLALAYLRTGKYTRAQLTWEISALRTTERPAWCTGTLGEELDLALRNAGFVPVQLAITPADAIVEIGGVTMRGMNRIWLAPGRYALRARRDGYVDGAQEVEVGGRSGSALVTLEEIAPPDAYVPDAGPADAAVIAEVVPDAAPVVDLRPPSKADPPDHAAMWPAWVALGVGGGALIGGFGFHITAVGTKDEANTLTTDNPAFATTVDRFERQRALALGGYVVGAAAIGFGVWYLMDNKADDDGVQVGAMPTGDGAAITIGGAW